MNISNNIKTQFSINFYFFMFYFYIVYKILVNKFEFYYYLSFLFEECVKLFLLEIFLNLF